MLTAVDGKVGGMVWRKRIESRIKLGGTLSHFEPFLLIFLCRRLEDDFTDNLEPAELAEGLLPRLANEPCQFQILTYNPES
jgi:hypothetical protein